MATIKAYLYCVKAGEELVRYSKELFEKELDFGDEQDYEGCCNELGLDPNKHYHVGKGFGEKNRLLVSGDEGYYMPFDKPLNGTICFECEINKVDEIRHDYSPLGDDLFFTKSVSIPVDFEKRTCLNTEQLNSYLPRYALYLENVEKISPRRLNDFITNDYGDADEIKHAPQNMMCAYYYSKTEKKRKPCIIISIQPQHLANIANGLKDIEARKSILNELKGLIK